MVSAYQNQNQQKQFQGPFVLHPWNNGGRNFSVAAILFPGQWSILVLAQCWTFKRYAGLLGQSSGCHKVDVTKCRDPHHPVGLQIFHNLSPFPCSGSWCRPSLLSVYWGILSRSLCLPGELRITIGVWMGGDFEDYRALRARTLVINGNYLFEFILWSDQVGIKGMHELLEIVAANRSGRNVVAKCKRLIREIRGNN